MLQEINKEVLIYLNSFTEFNLINNTVSYFADIPIFFLPIFLVTMWIYYTYKEKNKQKKHILLYIFYSVLIWLFINLLIKQVIVLERPEESIKWVWNLILSNIPNASFPSDHSAVSIAFLTSLFLAWYKKVWLYFFVFVIIMLISRVVVWVHWPLDIIVWIIVWLFSSFITFKYLIKCKILIALNKFIIKLMWYIRL